MKDSEVTCKFKNDDGNNVIYMYSSDGMVHIVSLIKVLDVFFSCNSF